MKVFITGATGYIGFKVALSFRRAGHQVFGLTRAAEKTVWLAQHEIHPIAGCLQQPESYAAIAGQCDALIHAGETGDPASGHRANGAERYRREESRHLRLNLSRCPKPRKPCKRFNVLLNQNHRREQNEMVSCRVVVSHLRGFGL